VERNLVNSQEFGFMGRRMHDYLARGFGSHLRRGETVRCPSGTQIQISAVCTWSVVASQRSYGTAGYTSGVLSLARHGACGGSPVVAAR
jgi:hypothetical protein